MVPRLPPTILRCCNRPPTHGGLFLFVSNVNSISISHEAESLINTSGLPFSNPLRGFANASGGLNDPTFEACCHWPPVSPTLT
jgi:hypothetical protein